MNNEALKQGQIVLDIYKSIDETLDRLLMIKKDKIARIKDDNNKEQKFFERMIDRRDKKQTQDIINGIVTLRQALYDFYYKNYLTNAISNDIINPLSDLNSLITEDESHELGLAIRSDVAGINNTAKSQLTDDYTKCVNVVKSLGFGNKVVNVFSKGTSGDHSGTYDSLLETIKQYKLASLELVSINLNSNYELRLNNDDQTLLDYFEKYKDNDKIKNVPSYKKILNNYKEIKENIINKNKASKINDYINQVLLELNQDNRFSNVKKCLEKLKVNYDKSLKKSEKYLEQYNFESILKDMKSVAEEKEEELDKDRLEKMFINYSYQLEQLQNENKDSEKIEEIKAKLANITHELGLTPEKQQELALIGQKQYHEEMASLKEQGDVVIKMHEDERDAQMEAYNGLRNMAIAELKREGALEETFEFRNGDAYSVPIPIASLIADKIEEIKTLATMTPEERGLYELKKHGRVSATTTLDDLTEQQKRDFAFAYRDESYPFMAEAKSLVTHPPVETMYKEYLRYRMGYHDGITFSQFVKEKYNVENIDESSLKI